MSGELEVGGQRVKVTVDLDATLRVGDFVAVPMTIDNPYGVPTAENEYWMVSDGKGAFSFSGVHGTRAVDLAAWAGQVSGLSNEITLGGFVDAIRAANLIERVMQ